MKAKSFILLLNIIWSQTTFIGAMICIAIATITKSWFFFGLSVILAFLAILFPRIDPISRAFDIKYGKGKWENKEL